MKGIDTHCHLQMSQYDSDREEVIGRAQAAGIGMICVGVDYATSKQAIDIANGHEGVWASVGLHPNDNLSEVYEQGIYEELAQNKKVIAIGEIGLDYYRTTDSDARLIQKKRFIEQLILVRKMNKPAIIHCRDAHEDMLSIIEETEPFKGVIHSFNGDSVIAQKYLEKGLYLGLNGIMTFSESYQDMIRSLPLDRILLETDAPYLTPTPYRGQRNEPIRILDVGNYIAGVRGESVINRSLENTKSLFSI